MPRPAHAGRMNVTGILLASLLLLALPTALAYPEEVDDLQEEIVVGDGPMRGKCIVMRGLTGVSVTLANCVPVVPPME